MRISDWSSDVCSSDLGSIWSWKLGLINQVTTGVELRATYSRDIRSPNLLELYSGQVLTLLNITDPQRNNDTYQIRSFAGGNPNLVPETSKTTTAGITLSPRFIPNLTISVDYFNINIRSEEHTSELKSQMR